MINIILKHRALLFLIAASYFFFMFGNGILSLTEPDEVFYSQTAREMTQHHSVFTPYLFDKPQFEKPILFYWLLQAAFSLFGNISFAARFFPALFASFGIIAVYWFGMLGFRDRKKAFFSALLLMSSGLYAGLARTVLIDTVFTVLILYALLSFFWGYTRPEKKNIGIILFFVFSALAVLAKGPLGLAISLGTVASFLFIKRNLRFLISSEFLRGFLVFLFLALPWYILMIHRYGSVFTDEFFINDHIRRFLEAEHHSNDTFYFYPLSLIYCLYPWGLFVIAGLIAALANIRKNAGDIIVFLLCWISVVFVIFSPAHSKLVSYIFPLYPALALLAGSYVIDKISLKKPGRLFYILSFGTLFFLLLVPAAIIILLVKFPFYISSYAPAYVYLALTIAFSLVYLFFSIRKRYTVVIGMLAGYLLLILSALPFVSGDIDPYVSSRKECEYLMRNFPIDGVILCSKSNVRGVRLFTDRKVAVNGIRTGDFFSPHPIPFLKTEEQVKSFFQTQKVTYCIVNKSSAEQIKLLDGTEFNVRELNVMGNKYILEVKPFSVNTGGALDKGGRE
jgi:4-amino-4-deoxy-L-arabinose transferase-like glycosyltransferase